MTFLLSSHILPELSRVCDAVAIIDQGKVLAYGKLPELYDKYAAGMIRISTDKPNELAAEIAKLPYVQKIDSDVRGVSVRVHRESEDRLYEDAPRLARRVDARLHGIETGSASLEELYKLVVGGNKAG
jgi:ABC-2 type transport system ATP-binding protein